MVARRSLRGGVGRQGLIDSRARVWLSLSISKFLNYSLTELSLEEVEKFINRLVSIYYDSRKILVLGAGRSGLVGRAFVDASGIG